MFKDSGNLLADAKDAVTRGLTMEDFTRDQRAKRKQDGKTVTDEDI